MNPTAPAFHFKSRRPDVPRFGMRLFLLSYVLFVFVGPVINNGTAGDWAFAALSIAAFVPIYWAVWIALDKRHDRRALLLTVAIALFGLVLIPFNVGANTYVVYSAALVPFLVPSRSAVAYLVLLVVGVIGVSLLLPPAARPWLIVPTAILIVMVGGGNLFYAEHQRRNALLWRAQEDVEEMATLAERERISRDLHDLLGHTLSAIALKSELASRLADSDPSRAAAEIRDVERVSREALSEVRGAVEGYRGIGLSGELRKAAGLLESSGVHLEARIAEGRLPPRQESVMALALREAVTNVVRHARATTCRVTIGEHDGRLVMTVQDDGIGGAPREGHGLTGMRERVAAAGGAVTIDATNGMIVIVAFPAPDASRPVSS